MRFATATTLLGLVAPLFAAERTSEPDPRRLRRTPIVEVFDRTKDAVVNISCKQKIERLQHPGFLDPFLEFGLPFEPRRRKRQSVGSGFILHSDGYVVTNAHVVLKTNDQEVSFVDGKKYPAQPIAIDTDNDLAVLKIEADHPLHALPIGRSDDLMIGETVIAIGNPLGYNHTLTTGVVSAVNRTLQFGEGVEYRGLIQTDAGINPGNSGGPLLNILGELIGVTTAIRGDAQNIGFAIPVDALRRALPGMLSLERLKRVQVGLQVSGRSVVRVTEVTQNSPAARAGIQAGDRIVSVDGKPVQQDVDVYFDLLNRKAEEKVVVTLERGGRRHNVEMRLTAMPVPDGARLAREKFGLHIVPLPADLARTLELEGGLIINGVDPGSDAARRRGIEKGTIIVAIGGYFPRNLEDLGLLLEDVKPGDVVVFNLRRVEQYGQTLMMRSFDIPLKAR